MVAVVWLLPLTVTAPADPLTELRARLTDAGQAAVGVPWEQLRPDGRELARAFFKPLLEGRGPVSPEKVAADAAPDKLAGHKGRADAVLAHRVSLLGGYEAQDLGTPLDWFRAPREDWQWPTHLSRHYWLRPAAWAYRAGGGEPYAAEVIGTLLDWVAKFPVGVETLDRRGLREVDGRTLCEGTFKGYVDGPWTSLSAHARVDTWGELLGLCWDSRALDNRAAAILLNSLYGDHLPLMLTYPRAMNQFQGVATSLVRLGTWWPGFQRTEEALRVGWERLARYAETEIYPDGSMAECSPNYALGCLRRTFEMAYGSDRPETGLMRERARLGLRYLALFADPAGRSPRIAKGGGTILGDLRQLNTLAADPIVGWLTGDRSDPAPVGLNHCWAWAGHAVIRSGWDKAATWLFFEPGPRGSGHHDLACLNLQLQAGGEWLLTDPGYYTYSSAGEEGAMARYLASTFAHNTATVDGLGQNRVGRDQRGGPNTAPGDYNWRETATEVSVEGVYQHGYGPERLPVEQHRRLVYHKADDRFTVTDTFTGAGRREVTLRWQAPPEARVEVAGARASIRGEKAELTLDHRADRPLAVTSVSGRREPLGGWFSATYGKLTEAPLIEVVASGELPLTITTELTITRR